VSGSTFDDPFPGEPPAAASVPPFAGLRRNARALFVGALLLVGLALLPDLTPPAEAPPPVELFQGRIVEFLDPGNDVTDPDVRIEIIGGERAGEVLDGYLQGPSGQLDLPRYEVGDEVIIHASPEPDGTFIAVADRYRIPVLGLVLGAFAVAVVVVGGWRGVRSLIALALTLGVVVRVVVPLLLAGWDPVPLAVATATGVTVVTFLLTEGLRRSTFAAALGTFLALALTAITFVVVTDLARFTEYQGQEGLAFLQSIGRADLDLGGLLLAATIFGALGVLDDVTVTQAATVHELWAADPSASRWELLGRAMNVGRSHIAATVNTLVMAYVGASLPLLVLFSAGRQDPLLTVSGELVAVEVVRAMVGSIGIVAAVPFTTVLGALLVGRRLPIVGDGSGTRPAPGWG
jgi:uncharacterized membrane protein